MNERNRIHYLLMLACTVAVVLFLLSLIGEDWIVNKNTAADYNYTFTDRIIAHRGLWRVCYLDGSCKRLDKLYTGEHYITTKWLQATRIAACLGTFLVLWGVFAAFFEPCHYRIRLHHSGVQLLVGPMCWLISMALYTKYEHGSLHNVYKWGWSFIIGWFATFFVPIVSFPVAWASLDE